MNEPVAVIIGAAIAAISGLSVALLTSWRQSRLEYDKWLRAKADDNNRWLQLREDDRQKDIRLAIVELTKKLSIGLHVMTWFTWKAKFTSTNFTK
ncbi:MAG: hypothetical protein KME31_28895 [Tolypothrix carrinoi HA7290-LM1]|nr:hypothetical protein [Tolypothrix carrinoi HA7290-LM1]